MMEQMRGWRFRLLAMPWWPRYQWARFKYGLLARDWRFGGVVMRHRPAPILDNIGITIRIADLPSSPRYVQLRDDLDAMCWLRRWLSFRMRREFEKVCRQQRVELLDAVMTAGDEAAGG